MKIYSVVRAITHDHAKIIRSKIIITSGASLMFWKIILSATSTNNPWGSSCFDVQSALQGCIEAECYHVN